MNKGGNFKSRKRNRLLGYDYALPAYYFVTVCTMNKTCFFGDVKNGLFCVNELGVVVDKQWKWLEKQFGDVMLDYSIVMPNHFHGIVDLGMTDRENVGTGHDLSLRQGGLFFNRSLSEIMGAFKSTSSKIIRRNFDDSFCWQRSFYDRVIRNDRELDLIRLYIRNNPDRWSHDRNHS